MKFPDFRKLAAWPEGLRTGLDKLVAASERIKDLDELFRRVTAIDNKLDRMWTDLDSLRTRISCYVGDGIALTSAVDDTILYVNSNDIGPPVNLMYGGRYEEENLEVLLSFVKPDSVFIDIGANVGFYALQIARRLTAGGKVYAFEPHPKLADLLGRNAYVNGMAASIECFAFALSDQTGPADMQYPVRHLGGGQVAGAGEHAGHTLVKSEMRRLDDVLGPEFICDLVKIDVEGHEMNVLNGMRGIVGRSPGIKILFEKLQPNAGNETSLESYVQEFGLRLYCVEPDSSLRELGSGELREWGGYVLAAAPASLSDGVTRAQFSIFPAQLRAPAGVCAAPPSPNEVLHCGGDSGTLLFHGPYWFLRRGRWRCKLHGTIRGSVAILILERFGHVVARFTLDETQNEHVLTLNRDLLNFECAARVASNTAEIDIRRLQFIRET